MYNCAAGAFHFFLFCIRSYRRGRDAMTSRRTPYNPHAYSNNKATVTLYTSTAFKYVGKALFIFMRNLFFVVVKMDVSRRNRSDKVVNTELPLHYISRLYGVNDCLPSQDASSRCTAFSGPANTVKDVRICISAVETR